MPTLIRIQKNRMWGVEQHERAVLGRKAAVATSSRVPWIRSLAMVRASPLGINTDAAVWARTSAISTETQSFVGTAKANYSDLHFRACWRIDCVLLQYPCCERYSISEGLWEEYVWWVSFTM